MDHESKTNCQICDDQTCSSFPLKLSLAGPQSFLSRDVRICFSCIDDLFFGSMPTEGHA